jgi:hypothetical protein
LLLLLLWRRLRLHFSSACSTAASTLGAQVAQVRCAARHLRCLTIIPKLPLLLPLLLFLLLLLPGAYRHLLLLLQ